MGIMMIAWLFVLVAAGFMVLRLGSARLPPASTSDQDRVLAQQAERIEQLEEELRLLKEQVDFTERLLSDRSEGPSDPPD